ncbi:hypothetical protein [Paractinoplanes rishiriensis]|uniref:Uncharacterized protein n=1 Tax=Paractinoplanes rishiriensis TaxID=1050105 RepID=A0A919MWB3_9ACTN|nr:hypothetical protein [Actinoplanes rishiriensis]GIE94490.1 hypothetical protein Ari01nite_19550 [Actinoplanes rishiriensis]
MRSHGLATVLTVGLALASTAAGSPTYHPATMTGFVTAGELRTAFGWTEAKLRTRAAKVTFSHTTLIEDRYAVRCGTLKTKATHYRQTMRMDLATTIMRKSSQVTGFRLAGAISGISGTSVAPAVGAPCPNPKGKTIDAVRLTSTTTTSALTANFRTESRDLWSKRC